MDGQQSEQPRKAYDLMSGDCLNNLNQYFERLIVHSREIDMNPQGEHFEEKRRILQRGLLHGWDPNTPIWGVLRFVRTTKDPNGPIDLKIHQVDPPRENNSKRNASQTPNILVQQYPTLKEASADWSRQYAIWDLPIASEPGQIDLGIPTSVAFERKVLPTD